MCVRKESMKFDIVWKDCIQEKVIVANKEALLREEDQALATHTRRRIQSNFKKNSHNEYRPAKKFQRKRENGQKKYYSKYQCYNCHNIGHLSRECPLKKNNNKIHHAHLAEDEDEEEEERPRKIQAKGEEERPQKRQAKEENIEEYVLFSALSRSVILGEDTWLINSGASKHLIGKKQTLSRL